jgi:general secretion pathway protein L
MKILSTIPQGFSRWIDLVAGSLAGSLDRLAPPRVVTLVEDETGEFAVEQTDSAAAANSSNERLRITEDGTLGVLPEGVAAVISSSRVEVVLQTSRFLFRPLELPARAVEFLDGIARSQIDRLTPWTAAEAAFGWSAPARSPTGSDRIAVRIAATALALVKPYAQAITAAGAHSVALYAAESEDAPARIKVLEHNAQAAFATGRMRPILIAVLAAAGITTAAALAFSEMAGSSLDAQQADLVRRIAAARAAAGATPDDAMGSVSARRALATRKNATPASVLVLETLAQVLPDHTYVTELRIEAGKLRLTGVTADAPSLIGILEQSGRFTRASFFAPTTRSPSEAGERFHIEAQIKGPARS